ncbi:sn-glycerol-3-phosphate ABC transporter ATP-binding protein UgpC [Pelagibacterium mangrovi]|uniref:sn-glycerol-3-phosphate ABC transporter ATP-binding protein UgpC n=1 Tax=Pelagibacterium mangrovi TaxID=3119828 RepID=UPI002FC79158
MAELSISDVKKSYEGKQVLHGVDVEIEAGQFVVIVGPSGCGKSTLLRMIAGLETITAGEISIAGEVVNDIDPADRGCAMVFQNYALYPHMTVAENIGYPLKIARLEKAERERRIREAAAILDLSDYLDRRPGQLSGGQRQRVAMGRAIVREPAVFLFDEPLSNLDAKLRVQMRIEIKKLHKRLGATSIFVTHDQVEAMTLADKLVVMNKGHIEQIGSPSSVYKTPASTFVAGFMGAPAMNLTDGELLDASTLALDFAPYEHFRLPHSIQSTDTRVTIGFRPEEILISKGGKGLKTQVELIEELGGSRVAYCTAGSNEFAVVVPPALELVEGDTASLDIPSTAFHLFDAQSGKRLKAETPVAKMAFSAA